MGIRKSIVILSTGRTGTMFFADLLRDRVPDAAVYHEAGERSRLINIFTHAHLSGFLPRAAPLWAWNRAVRPRLTGSSQSIYIDSNNQLYAFLPLQPELYPELRVVHLVRDPRDYVRSHLNWARHRLKSFIANYLTPFWQPNASLLHEMDTAQWRKLSRFERYCWIWDFKNRTMAQLEGGDVPYLRIRFEDFFEGPEPAQAVDSLLEFLEIEAIPDFESRLAQPVNPARKKSVPHWSDWSREQCRQLDRRCGETMALYGYGQEAEWRSKLGDEPSDRGGVEAAPGRGLPESDA